ncbi:MAG TPA: CehA/McbA family metallohydrolase, partial [Lacipirellulaceae bacterium]
TDLLFFKLETRLDAKRRNVGRSSLKLIEDARAADAQIVAGIPYAWDMPVWLASSELDAVCLINHHALRDGVVDNEKDGRPRDRSLFPGRTGNGRWAEAVYYHILNCGLRIAPAAGSGSGMNDNPVGTNRVYVYCGQKFSNESWWEGLEAGRVFVTNGPLLRPMVEGQPPGHVFRLAEGETLTLEIAIELATRVPVEYLQIVKNGIVENEVRLADWTKQKGRLPPLQFDDSGWFLIRAVTTNERTYQFASTGPYYVEKAGRPRVSRRSVQFFLDWIAAADARVRELSELDNDARQALLAEHQSARRYFEELREAANED